MHCAQIPPGSAQFLAALSFALGRALRPRLNQSRRNLRSAARRATAHLGGRWQETDAFQRCSGSAIVQDGHSLHRGRALHQGRAATLQESSADAPHRGRRALRYAVTSASDRVFSTASRVSQPFRAAFTPART